MRISYSDGDPQSRSSALTELGITLREQDFAAAAAEHLRRAAGLAAEHEIELEEAQAGRALADALERLDDPAPRTELSAARDLYADLGVPEAEEPVRRPAPGSSPATG